MKEKYYQFLEWKTKTVRRFAFWLMGWRNIEKLDVLYHPDPQTFIHFHRKPDGNYSTILEIKTFGESLYE